jgi:LAS superfamily LD-carboxypeptidase LdcB
MVPAPVSATLVTHPWRPYASRPVSFPAVTRVPPRAPAGPQPRGSRLLTLLLAAAVAAAGLAAEALSTPAAAFGMGPLPACRYDDILTAPRTYGEWPMTLVDTILRVPKTYLPPDLVSVSGAGIGGSGSIRALVIDDLRALSLAAKAAGNPIAVASAYRSYATQQSVYQGYVDSLGEKQARLISARPGHSEHQLGIAIDFKSAGGGSPFEGDWGTTAAGTWMRVHAWEYGFVMSYPKGKRSKTCYDYEPWHFRYLGHDMATKIHDSGLTIRQYLWSHFTTAVVPAVGNPSPPPSATPSRAPSAPPSEIPSDVPSAAPSPEATAAATIAPSPSAPFAAESPPASPAPTAGPAPVGTSGLDPTVVAILALVGLVIAASVALAALRDGRRRGHGGA